MTPGADSGETTVDARGLLCPLPLLRLTAHLESVPPGATAVLLADDPAAAEDVRLWCLGQGQEWLGSEEDGSAMRIRVRRVR